MTINKHSAGLYYASGTLSNGHYAQYSVMKMTSGLWRVTKTYGIGAEISASFATKREAISALRGQANA
jgi:hypothetical protein